MQTTQILLFLILITLLGAWPFVGIIALVWASIVAIFTIVSFIFSGIGYLAEISSIFRTAILLAASIIGFILFFGWLSYFLEYISPLVEGTFIENVLVVFGSLVVTYLIFDALRNLYNKYQKGEIENSIWVELEKHKAVYIIGTISAFLCLIIITHSYLTQ